MTPRLKGLGATTTKTYRALPEGHRTTFVSGMADMLGLALLYASEAHQPRLDAMLQHVVGRQMDAVRQRFDEYLDERAVDPDLGVAGCFASALNEWCGFDNRKGDASATWFKRLLG